MKPASACRNSSSFSPTTLTCNRIFDSPSVVIRSLLDLCFHLTDIQYHVRDFSSVRFDIVEGELGGLLGELCSEFEVESVVGIQAEKAPAHYLPPFRILSP